MLLRDLDANPELHWNFANAFFQIFQGIAENVLTISPGRWMALPGSEMKEYREGRAPAPAVFRYYNEYIHTHGLAKNMENGSTVTLVQPINSPVRINVIIF